MARSLGLILAFYRNFFILSLAITLCAAFLFAENGTGILTLLILFKLVTLALAYYFISSYKRKEFYYYMNLGLSIPALWAVAFCMDLILFAAILILTRTFH